MKLYYSGVNSLETLKLLRDYNINRVLISYHNIGNTRTLLRGTSGMDVFCDSGAFSMMTQGVKIDIYKYARFLLRYKRFFDVYANLDVIGNAEKTLKNQFICSLNW